MSNINQNPDSQISRQYEMNNQLYQTYKNQQIHQVKQFKIADYYSNNQGDNSVRGQSFKQMMLKTLMNRKKSVQKPSNSNSIQEKGLKQYQGSPYMEERVQVDKNPSIQMVGLQQVNIEEEAVNQILNQSDINNISYISNQNAQKQGILDVEKFYELISHRQAQETQRIDRQEENVSVLIKSNEKESIQQNQPQANLTKKQKWQLVKSYIEKNPQILLEEQAQDHNFEQQALKNHQQQQNIQNFNDSLFDDQSQLSGYDQSFRSQSLLKSKLQRNLDLSKQIISESIIEENNATMDETITSSHLLSKTGNTGYSRSVQAHYSKIQGDYSQKQQYVSLKKEFQRRSGDRPFSINKRRERSGLLKKPRNSQLANISEFQNKTQDLKQFNIRPQSKSSIRYLDSQNFISIAPQSTMNINQTHDLNQENLQIRQSFSQNNSLPRFINQNNAQNDQIQNHSFNRLQKDGKQNQISGGVKIQSCIIQFFRQFHLQSLQTQSKDQQSLKLILLVKQIAQQIKIILVSINLKDLKIWIIQQLKEVSRQYSKKRNMISNFRTILIIIYFEFLQKIGASLCLGSSLIFQNNKNSNYATVYSNEDIDYMINMIRLNEKAFEKSNTLSQILNKTINTITRQCNDLDLDKVAIKIYYHYADRDSKTLLKLLLRCKEFFVIRVRIVKILKLIHDREILIGTIKSMIMEFSQSDEKELSLRNSDKSIQLRQLNYNINNNQYKQSHLNTKIIALQLNKLQINDQRTFRRISQVNTELFVRLQQILWKSLPV